MSFTVTIYRREVFEKASTGTKLVDFEHPKFTDSQMVILSKSLKDYGYHELSVRPDARPFQKSTGRTPIDAALYSTELTFSVPYGPDSEDAIFEALQDASEIADSESMAVWDPQSEEWVV